MVNYLKLKLASGVKMIEIKTIQQLFPKKNKAQPRRLMAVFSHPDDESLNAAGVLAKASQESIKTYLVCLTNGKKGVVDPKLSGNKLKKKRVKELKKASKILGINQIFIHDLPDGELFYHRNELKRILKKTTVQVNPGVIVTHDPSGGTGHPDHIVTSLIVKSVVSNFFEEDINLHFIVLGGELREIMKKSGDQSINWQTMPEPTHWLDVNPFVGIKVKACLAHRSQKLAQTRPVSLKVWYQLFDREYLHQVELEKKYRFRFVRFKTNCFKFIPPDRKIQSV